jgi:hypothetical protein
VTTGVDFGSFLENFGRGRLLGLNGKAVENQKKREQ